MKCAKCKQNRKFHCYSKHNKTEDILHNLSDIEISDDLHSFTNKAAETANKNKQSKLFYYSKTKWRTFVVWSSNVYDWFGRMSRVCKTECVGWPYFQIQIIVLFGCHLRLSKHLMFRLTSNINYLYLNPSMEHH